MVYEFPELQGVMGRYYALEAGESEAVADAARDHYAPLGPSDEVPTAPVTVAVALADKIDTLTGFWAIDEKPTGSKDPYALRRAALGILRLLIGNRFETAFRQSVAKQLIRFSGGGFVEKLVKTDSDISEVERLLQNELAKGNMSSLSPVAMEAWAGCLFFTELQDSEPRLDSCEPSIKSIMGAFG